MTIPPDLDSCTQHILRSHLVAFKWINFDKMIMPNINPYENGWKLAENNTLLPVWFTGSQLPPPYSKQSSKKQTVKDSYEADCERDNEQREKIKRKKKSNKEGPGSKFRKDDLPRLLEEVDEADIKEEHSSKKPSSDECELLVLNSEVGSAQQTPAENPELSGYHGEPDDETQTDDVVGSSDEWEHLSDFEVTESSGSDWM